MKILITLIIFFLNAFITRAQETTIELKDLRKEGVRTHIWDWNFKGKELDKIYVDKILWAYQPTSENPYTAIAYRIQYFKKEKNNKIINYQMITQAEEDYDQATYHWKSDTVAYVTFKNSVTYKAVCTIAEKRIMGYIPIETK